MADSMALHQARAPFWLKLFVPILATMYAASVAWLLRVEAVNATQTAKIESDEKAIDEIKRDFQRAVSELNSSLAGFRDEIRSDVREVREAVRDLARERK